MPIPYVRFVWEGLAIEPEDVQVGDEETKEVPINLGAGGIINVKLKRKNLTLKAKGPVGTRFTEFENTRYNNTLAAINGSLVGADIEIFGETIYNAYLDEVTQSGAVSINGRVVFNELTLKYVSLDYV